MEYPPCLQGKDRRDSFAGWPWILYLTLVQLVFVGTINDEDFDLQGPSSVAGWLATVSGRSAASWQAGKVRLRGSGMCTPDPLRIHGTKFQRAHAYMSEQRACLGHWGGPARDLLPNTSVPFS